MVDKLAKKVASRFILNQRVAFLFKASQFELRYARMLLAMSLEEAKGILGFPPGVNPSSAEIAKAYKTKVVQNHPDLGGSHEKMVAVNVAKDVLDGKQRPTLDRGGPPGGWKPRDEYKKKEPMPTVDTIKGVSFNTAVSKVPSGVEWKFLSTSVYNSGTNNGSYSCDVWVVVGKTSAKWVVVGVQRRLPNSRYDVHRNGKIEIEENWEFDVKEAPLSSNPVKQFPSMIKGATGMFSDGTMSDTPKKFVAWSGGDLSETAIKAAKGSGGASLKDILVGTGILSSEHKSVSGRKTVVEMWPKFSLERKSRMTAKKGKNLQSPDVYDFFVRVNGHEFLLEDQTIENLEKSGFFFAVFKYKFDSAAPKQLNKVRGTGIFGAGPAVVITLLADALTSEPTALHLALQKAAEEYTEETSKTASWSNLRERTTLKHAAETAGVPLFEFFTTLYG